MSEIFAGYTVLTKSMLGVGLLGVANALSLCGWSIGIPVSLAAPVIMLFALHLLSRLAYDFKQASKDESADLTFYNVAHRVSPAAAWVLEVAVVITSVGSAIAYSFVSGTMLADVVWPQYKGEDKSATLKADDDGYNQVPRWLIQLGFAAVLAYPCFMKEIKKTTMLNAAAILCLAYVVIIAITSFNSVDRTGNDYTNMNQAANKWTVFRKINTFTFAYCCTHNLFSVGGSLSKFTVKRLDSIAAMATVTGVIFMTITAVLPYYTFGKAVKSNFLENLSSTDVSAKIARIAAALQVSIGFVLVIHPTRNSIIGMMYKGGKPADKDEFKVRFLVTLACMVVSVGVALAVKVLSEPLDIAGLLGANTMCFAVPAFLFLKAASFKDNKFTWIASAVLLAFSTAIYFLGSIAIIKTWGQ